MTIRFEDLNVWPTGLARYRGRILACAIGRGGVVSRKREGDGGTPTGAFRIECVMRRPDRVAPISTKLRVRTIRAGDGWCDAPDDPRYNQPIRRPYAASHERLRRADPLYDLIAVLDANRRPIIAGGGSAIFLHVWAKPRHPTAGCVAFRVDDLRWILSTWGRRARVVVYPS